MALVCSRIALTWYDGPYPSAEGDRVLLGADELLDSASPLSGAVEQLVQRADYVRGGTPGLWARGNKTTSLDWERLRPFVRHDAALVDALVDAEDMPVTAGWVSLSLPDFGRQWALTPAVVRRIGWGYRVGELHLGQRWAIDCGTIVEIAAELEDDRLVAATGHTLLSATGEKLERATAA